MYWKLLGFFIFLTPDIYAQTVFDSLAEADSYIINATTYKRGVYKTFEEFKYNNPSIVDNYTVDGKNIWLTRIGAGKRKKIKRGDIWGFCDGSKIFISWNKFNEIQEKGRYCYFREKGIKLLSVYTFPPFLVPIPLPYDHEVIINFNTGKTYGLSKRIFKYILKTDDPELLEEFMNERGRGKKLHEYLVKYNGRNVGKIK